MTVNTKKAERRDIRFGSIVEMLGDAERLAAADANGTLKRTGNWSAGQNFEHLGKFIELSLDGFPGKLPLPLRLFGRLIRNSALKRPPPAGFKIPGSATFLLPENQVTTEAGITRLRRAVGRIEAGEQCTHPSPLLGPLSHDEWLQLHCRHAELHLSFLQD